jgi:hypothetical protein
MGSDGFRLLIHKSIRTLRGAANALSDAYASDDEALIAEAEMWLQLESDVHWFAHDWSYWDPDQDAGALESLGWERRVVESGGRYRVTLRLAKLRSRR